MYKKAKRIPRKSFSKVATMLCFGIGFLVSFGLTCILKPTSEQVAVSVEERSIEVCFSPKGGCTALLVKAIDDAQESIYVAAYTFKRLPVVKALLGAIDRGIKVCILLDKKNYDKYLAGGVIEDIERLKRMASVVYVYDKKAQSHDKNLIIDHKHLTTGSFNFDDNAENNFENLLYIRNDAVLARSCTDHWFSGEKERRIRVADYDKGVRYQRKKRSR